MSVDSRHLPAPAQSGKAILRFVDKSPDTAQSRLVWQWIKGKATPKSDFGDPLNTDSYILCIYDNDTLVSAAAAPAALACGSHSCWKDRPTGFTYRNGSFRPSGIALLTLKEGLSDGDARIHLKAKGVNLQMPDVGSLIGPIDVQLRKSSSGVCWGAHYSVPFLKDQNGIFKDRAD